MSNDEEASKKRHRMSSQVFFPELGKIEVPKKTSKNHA
jgi:hypothetical protein